MISKEYLLENYIERRRSVSSIARELGCSQNKVNYWLQKFEIPKRTVAEAAYAKHNPDGDPFCFSTPQSNEDWFLYGLGLGLFWGEGNKVNRHAVRLGNTDPGLIRMFLDFLVIIFRIDESRLRFGLQIFSDVNPRVAQAYW